MQRDSPIWSSASSSHWSPIATTTLLWQRFPPWKRSLANEILKSICILPQTYHVISYKCCCKQRKDGHSDSPAIERKIFVNFAKVNNLSSAIFSENLQNTKQRKPCALIRMSTCKTNIDPYSNDVWTVNLWFRGDCQQKQQIVFILQTFSMSLSSSGCHAALQAGWLTHSRLPPQCCRCCGGRR